MKIPILFFALLGLNSVAGMELHVEIFYNENEGQEATESFIVDLPVEGDGLMRAEAPDASDDRSFFAIEESKLWEKVDKEKAIHKPHKLAHWKGAVTPNEGGTLNQLTFRALTTEVAYRVQGDTSSPANPQAASDLVDTIAYAIPNDEGEKFKLTKCNANTTPSENGEFKITRYIVLMLDN